MDDAWAEYLGMLNHELAAYFAGLRLRYRTGILSNSVVGAREREQALYGFEDMCDTIVYSHEVGWRKPDPRIYWAVCDRLETAPGTLCWSTMSRRTLLAPGRSVCRRSRSPTLCRPSWISTR